MTAYYRNLETGIVQSHPVSGLAESFNSVEIGEDGKPVKPYIPLGTDPKEAAKLTKLAKASDQTTGTNAGDSNKQEGTK